MAVERFAFTVHGHVQGVCFRQSAQQTAHDLSISGFVRNTAAGAVAGEAEGSPDNLKNFHSWLAQGPKHAHVLSLEWDKIQPRKDGEGHGYRMAHSSDPFAIARGLDP